MLGHAATNIISHILRLFNQSVSNGKKQLHSFKMYFITTLWFLIVFYGTLVSVVAIFAICTLTNFYP